MGGADQDNTFPGDRFISFFLEHTPDLLCIAGADGVFRYINPAWSRLLGYPQEELRTRPYVSFVHPDDQVKTRKEAQKVAEGKGTIMFENRYVCKDGTVVWLAWNTVFDPERDRIYAIARNVTARKEAEAARLRLHQNIAHDMATPLSAIRLHIAAQERSIGDSQQTLPFLKRNVERLVRLVSDARDAQQIETGRLSVEAAPTDLADMVVDVAVDLTGHAELHRIRLDVQTEPAPVEADEDRMRQAVTNLVHNAIKFSPSGGRVTVACRSEGKMAEVTVTDQGFGVRNRDQRRLFEPYVQLDNARYAAEKGTGLGLFIAKELVEAHGGTIDVQSDGPGKGSCFRFRIPLRSAD